jgi:hypothetical protein
LANLVTFYGATEPNRYAGMIADADGNLFGTPGTPLPTGFSGAVTVRRTTDGAVIGHTDGALTMRHAA